MSYSIGEQSRRRFSQVAILSSIIGIICGYINGFVVAAVLPRFIGEGLIPVLAAFLVSGLIAGAIQGAWLKRWIKSKHIWIFISGLGWMLTQIPYYWPVAHVISVWACDDALRWGLIGAITGIVISSLQSLILNDDDHNNIFIKWVSVNMLIWFIFWLTPVVLLGSFFMGEGTCTLP